MPSTIVENGELEVPIGKTVTGSDLVIVATQTGMYKIECRGPGVPPPVCNEVFTSLLLAKRAMENYRRANAARYAKEALKQRIVENPSNKEQRRLDALKLKNGELSTPDLDDDED